MTVVFVVGLGLTVVGLWFDRGLFLFDTGFGAVCVEGMKTFRVSSLSSAAEQRRFAMSFV